MTHRICCICTREGHLAHACPQGPGFLTVARQQPQTPPAAPVCQACQKPLVNLEGLLMCVQPGCLG